MKIKADVLAKFVKKISLDGKIDGSIYTATPEGLKVVCKDITNMGMTKGLLANVAFTEYGEGMKLPVRNNKRFMDLLGEYGGNEVGIVSQMETIFITGKNTAGDTEVGMMRTVKEELVDTHIDELPDTLVFDWVPVKVNTQLFARAKSHISILKQDFIFLKVDDNMLEVRVGEDNFDQIIQKQPLECPNFELQFGEIFQDVVNILGDSVSGHFRSGYPLKLTEKTEQYMLEIIVAPIVDEEKTPNPDETKTEDVHTE